MPKIALILALVAATLFQCAVRAQDTIISSNRETSFDRNHDRFSDSLDSLGDRMARSYDERRLAAAHSFRIHSDSMGENLAAAQMAHQRVMDSMVLGRNFSDQSPYNQGNNQSNNGFLPGTLQGGSLLGSGFGFGLGAFGNNGISNLGLFPGSFGTFPFPGTFGTAASGPFAMRPGQGNSSSTFTRTGSTGFNGQVTTTNTGNPFTQSSTRTTTLTGTNQPTF